MPILLDVCILFGHELRLTNEIYTKTIETHRAQVEKTNKLNGNTQPATYLLTD